MRLHLLAWLAIVVVLVVYCAFLLLLTRNRAHPVLGSAFFRALTSTGIADLLTIAQTVTHSLVLPELSVKWAADHVYLVGNVQYFAMQSLSAIVTLHVLLISFNRYDAVLNPTTFVQKWSTAFVMRRLVGIWLVPLALCLPLLIGVQFHAWRSPDGNLMIAPKDRYVSVITALIRTVYNVVCVVCITFVYVKIAIALRKQSTASKGVKNLTLISAILAAPLVVVIFADLGIGGVLILWGPGKHLLLTTSVLIKIVFSLFLACQNPFTISLLSRAVQQAWLRALPTGCTPDLALPVSSSSNRVVKVVPVTKPNIAKD